MNAGNRGQTIQELISQLKYDEEIQRKKRSKNSRSNPNFERWFFEAETSTRPIDERVEVESFNIKVTKSTTSFVYNIIY